MLFYCFFFNDTATTEIYTLSLHDALPIFISRKYENESFITKSHILVHALHKKIFIKFFGKKRLNKEIDTNKYYPEYKRSWEIVNNEGEDIIINNFKDYLRLLDN